MDMPNAYVVGGMANSGPIIEFVNCLVAGEINCTHVNCATLGKSGTDGNIHVTNCYFKTALNITQGRYVDDAALASGEVCYRLNADREEPVWFQTIDVDPIPVFDNTHGIVVRNEDGSYGNITDIETVHSSEPRARSGVYDLSGRRISVSSVLPKGVYIVDGEKVLIK
jgi:hypothetical protein